MTYNDNEEEFNKLYFHNKTLNPTSFATLLNRWDTAKNVIVPRKDMVDSLEKLQQLNPEWVLQQALIIFKNKDVKETDLLAVKTNDDFVVPVNGRLYDSIKIEAKKRGVSVDDLTRYLTTLFKNSIFRG